MLRGAGQGKVVLGWALTFTECLLCVSLLQKQHPVHVRILHPCPQAPGPWHVLSATCPIRLSLQPAACPISNQKLTVLVTLQKGQDPG